MSIPVCPECGRLGLTPRGASGTIPRHKPSVPDLADPERKAKAEESILGRFADETGWCKGGERPPRDYEAERGEFGAGRKDDSDPAAIRRAKADIAKSTAPMAQAAFVRQTDDWDKIPERPVLPPEADADA